MMRYAICQPCVLQESAERRALQRADSNQKPIICKPILNNPPAWTKPRGKHRWQQQLVRRSRPHREFRTAAKVIRYICDKSDEMQRKMPLLEKLWWKMTRENNDELRRKSAVIESIADGLETPNVKSCGGGE